MCKRNDNKVKGVILKNKDFILKDKTEWTTSIPNEYSEEVKKNNKKIYILFEPHFTEKAIWVFPPFLDIEGKDYTLKRIINFFKKHRIPPELRPKKLNWVFFVQGKIANKIGGEIFPLETEIDDAFYEKYKNTKNGFLCISYDVSSNNIL